MNKFTKQLKAVLAKLGLTEKAQKKELTDSDKVAVADTYKTDYGVDLDKDAEEYQSVVAKAAAYDKIMSGVDISEGDKPEVKKEAEEKPASGTAEAKPATIAAAAEAQADAVIAKIDDMKKTLKETLAKAQTDTPEAKLPPMPVLGMAHTKTHLYGIEHPMFSMDKRWNQVARYGKEPSEDADDKTKSAFREEFGEFSAKLSARFRELKSLGLITDHKLGAVDYSAITSNTEIGTAFIVRRMDALISRIVSLPSVDALFPVRSNIQDGEMLTNAFFDEMSQPYEEGEVSKGGYNLQPELARVHDVMFKYLIKSFKWIEKTYLGYLNTSGSDPIKWNMIEWFILNVATQLRKERNRRAIRGYRVNPTTGSSRHANFSAFGLLHTLIRYWEDNKVYPFKGSSYVYASSSDIGDIFEAFAAQVFATVEDPESYVLYANAKHRPWYRAWYVNKYKTAANFDGVIDEVENYKMKIVWVPNMGNSKFLFATIPGNLQQLENVPGEMNKISFQQDLESVWAWSVWMEGFAATYSGKKFASQSDLIGDNRAHQIVFMNWPETAVAADATTIDASASSDNLFKTGANTAAAALTDITNAKQGEIYRIEIGDIAHATNIAKSGKFSDISEAWSPTALGAWIKLYYNGSKFIDVARS